MPEHTATGENAASSSRSAADEDRGSPEMVLMQGLPGSGKSTVALAWVAEDPAWRTRVNRDDLRQMIFNVGGRLTVDQEHVVTEVETVIASSALSLGRSVVVDDTNLSLAVVDLWQRIADKGGVAIRVVAMNTDVEQCIRRDRARGAAAGRSVGANVIRLLAETNRT